MGIIKKPHISLYILVHGFLLTVQKKFGKPQAKYLMHKIPVIR